VVPLTLTIFEREFDIHGTEESSRALELLLEVQFLLKRGIFFTTFRSAVEDDSIK
jgi:hypothetical protein